MKPPVQKRLFRHNLLSTLNAISTLVILDLSPSSSYRFASFPQPPDRNRYTPGIRSSPCIRQPTLALDAQIQRHVQRASGEE
jgi:hypothetical protein